MTTRWRRLAVAALCAALASASSAEEFAFDAAEFAKKPFELGGYLEAKPQYFWLDPGSAGYRIVYPDGSPGTTIDGITGTLEIVGKYTAQVASAYFRTHSEIQRYETVKEQSNKLYEGVLSLRQDPGLSLDVGKRALQWGKGYASTFVGFVQRPKNPDDPELAREGYTIGDADVIANFPGPLQALAFTPVVLPVTSSVNSDFGTLGYTNVAAKLYALYEDTDIDVMYLANGSRSARAGIDFSRNLASNFEVHGEFAYVWNAITPIASASGQVTTQRVSAANYMLGLRYLSERDTTSIVEYYHNGLGYDRSQMQQFFADLEGGGNVTPSISTLHATYGRIFAMRNYLYAQVTQKEPFDILYFAPALTGIVNLDDRSFQLTPELLFTGIENLELRLRLYILGGGAGTEFGERQLSQRLELRLRYYF